MYKKLIAAIESLVLIMKESIALQKETLKLAKSEEPCDNSFEKTLEKSEEIDDEEIDDEEKTEEICEEKKYSYDVLQELLTLLISEKLEDDDVNYSNSDILAISKQLIDSNVMKSSLDEAEKELNTFVDEYLHDNE